VTCPFRQNSFVSSNSCYYVQKQVQPLRLLSMNENIVFHSFQINTLQYFIYLFSSALLISLIFPFIRALSFFSGRVGYFFFWSRLLLNLSDFSSNYSRFTRVYCIHINWCSSNGTLSPAFPHALHIPVPSVAVANSKGQSESGHSCVSWQLKSLWSSTGWGLTTPNQTVFCSLWISKYIQH
jgi:hypothetical protein